MALGLLVLLTVGVACQREGTGRSNEVGAASVTGSIVRVESLSLVELEVLEVRDESGKVWTFEAQRGRFGSFTPSHLREHQVLGLKVQVQYHEEAGALVIDGITD